MEDPQHISRDRVVEVIKDLMLNDIVHIDMLSKRLEKVPEERESMRRRIRYSEEVVFTLMKVAEELGVYEDVNRKIKIPRHPKRDYFGEDHPTYKVDTNMSPG
jgi:hypothetical protein